MNSFPLSLVRPTTAWKPIRRVVLLDQPVDILRIILDFLTPEEAMALSRTCRRFYSTFTGHRWVGPKLTDLPPESQQQFALLIERDVGDRCFFCHFCRRLHEGGYHRNYKALPVVARCMTHPRFGRDATIFGTMTMDFNLVRIFMNTHLFETKQGRGSETLVGRDLVKIRDMSGWLTPASPRWKILSSTARIINDRLHLRVQHHCELRDWGRHRRVPSGWDIAPVDSSRVEKHQLCPHLRAFSTEGQDGGLELLQINRCNGLCPQGGHKVQSFRQQGVQSCKRCLTDLDVEIDINHGKPVPVNPDICSIHGPRQVSTVTVTAYHDLGPCRNPHSAAWRSFWCGWPEHHPFLLYQRDLPAGAVKAEWENPFLADLVGID